MHHFGNHFLEGGSMAPTQLPVRLAWIAKQDINFSGPKILLVHRDQNLPSSVINTDLG